MMKTCTMCKVEFPATSDNFNKRGKILQSNCKPCNKEYLKNWYKKNKEEKDLKNRTWYYENAKARIEQTNSWAKANPDLRRSYTRKSMHKRRALILGNGHTPYTEEQVLKTYGTNCNICSLPVDLKAARQCGLPGWENGLHIDHLIPISKNGPDTLENVRPTHGLCNITKNNKEQHENQTA